MTQKLYPHELLEGMLLKNGWRVLNRLEKPESGSGGTFSCGYLAERSDGQRGYLKALDFFSRLPENEDPARALAPLLDAFNFERDLLSTCRNYRLSRIVTALDDGAITVPNVPPPATVQYIIFELAEGDVRKQMEKVDNLDPAWMFRSLHHMALGLQQLHAHNAAHQDVKPSNVLLFDNFNMSKLGDVGRAAVKGIEPPHYSFPVAGDWSYAPPELLYGAVPGSWDGKRVGCDLYLLGSMIASFFTGVAMTPLILDGLDRPFHWTNWHGNYAEVLPYLRVSFYDAVSYVSDEFPPDYREELREILKQLCDPDPSLRGHPRDKGMESGNPYSVRRYVNHFDLLARKAETKFSKGTN
jgi:serine/threonine protein kinase